jgi:hypothetical protein
MLVFDARRERTWLTLAGTGLGCRRPWEVSRVLVWDGGILEIVNAERG